MEGKATPTTAELMDQGTHAVEMRDTTPEKVRMQGAPHESAPPDATSTGAGSMHRAHSEAMAMDTIHQKRQRQRPALLHRDVQLMPDFSDLLPPDYREKYRQWRQGKPKGAKGEANRPSSYGVTLVYDHGAPESKWALHLMCSERGTSTRRASYEAGYATWKFATEEQRY